MATFPCKSGEVPGKEEEEAEEEEEAAGSGSPDGQKGPALDDDDLHPQQPQPPREARKNGRWPSRGSQGGSASADGGGDGGADGGGAKESTADAGADSAASPASVEKPKPELLEAPAGFDRADLAKSAIVFELLPAASTSLDFSRTEALAIRLYRQRLPNCNCDLPVACSPRHPGMTPRRREGGGDFLQLLVHGTGARTAVARRVGGKEGLLAACTFIPHESDGRLCELQLLAVSRGHSGKGIGSCLLAHVESWLRAQGVRTCVALAGLDTVEFWRKRRYVEVHGGPGSGEGKTTKRRGGAKPRGSSASTATLTTQQWSLIRDPFGSSQAMLKTL